ncbi:MAG: DUF2797 domain-containing protein [Candidatus Thermoplasmatota archaeon]|nr:DUF2797 domain-containing protein [Candidatus Thermoplasmatota archaeon]
MSSEQASGPKDREEAYPLHALEYHWEEFEPHLGCYDTSERKVCELDLEDVRFRVSKQKTCVGYWDDDGRYVLCPRNAPVTRFSQCPDCSREVFLPDQECIFEPKCDGELCGIEFCSREHLLYIAFYDTRMKIGMSSSRRVEERLIEQGADAYSVIGKFSGRKRARTHEKKISERLGIPQAYRQELLLRNLSRPLDTHGILGRLEGLRMTLREAYGLSPEPLVWLRDYPIELPLAEVPRLEQSWGEHSGEYVGIKGKWVIFDDRGLKALNLSDFPGRFLARDVA